MVSKADDEVSSRELWSEDGVSAGVCMLARGTRAASGFLPPPYTRSISVTKGDGQSENEIRGLTESTSD